jgi:hypothetical protein
MVSDKNLRPDQIPDFCVTVHFERNAKNPERIFKAAASIIEAMQTLDGLLVTSIDTKIKAVLVLENIEAGSIKVMLKHFLTAIDDEAVKKLDWRPAVGKYLLQGKHYLIRKLDEWEGLRDGESLEIASGELRKMAEESGVLVMPGYRSLPPREIAESMRRISESVQPLREGEAIDIESDLGMDTVWPGVTIPPERIEEILAKETIETRTVRILMIRRPDFLGETMWEFKYERKSYSAKIADEEWLSSFRAGYVDIRPGDALRAEVLERASYDRRGEVISESRTILKVLTVIHQERMTLPSTVN